MMVEEDDELVLVEKGEYNNHSGDVVTKGGDKDGKDGSSSGGVGAGYDPMEVDNGSTIGGGVGGKMRRKRRKCTPNRN